MFFIFVFFCLSVYFLFFIFSFWCLSSYNYFLLYHSFFLLLLSGSPLYSSSKLQTGWTLLSLRVHNCRKRKSRTNDRSGRKKDRTGWKTNDGEKKKHKRKNKESDKRPTRKKEEKMHFCASDVETQPRPSQKKVLMNVELGTTWCKKKGLGLWYFSCSNDVLWAQKRLAYSRLWSAMQPPSFNICLLFQVVLHAGAGLDRALPVPLILAVPIRLCMVALVARWRVGSPLRSKVEQRRKPHHDSEKLCYQCMVHVSF